LSGSGLGLAFVEKHVHTLQGVIKFESSEDGSRFSIEIPLDKK
jgi:signal transduction histidine kinase